MNTLHRDRPRLNVTRRTLVLFISCLASFACGDDEAQRELGPGLATTSIEDARSSRPARVVLVSIDTLRADHVGFMGSQLGVTPNLDSLARKGTIFGTTLSRAPLTLPSHATLLTGLDPPAHGVHHNGLFSLDCNPSAGFGLEGPLG